MKKVKSPSRPSQREGGRVAFCRTILIAFLFFAPSLLKVLPFGKDLGWAPLFSQITITQTDMPNVGDTLRVSITNTIGTLSPDSTGPNYVWDFTTLVPNSQDVEQFIVGSSTGYQILPILSSYGYKTNKIDTTNRVDFFKENSTCYRQMGYGQIIGGFPAPIIYNPSDTIYRFPMNFANMDSCTSGYGFQIPGIGYYGSKTKRVNNVDGWGTLITPFGTFQTLRIKSTLYRTDTIYIDTLSFGFSIPLPLQYEYKWLAQGEKIPMLLIIANDVLGNPLVTNVIYRDSIRAGVAQVGIEAFPVYGFQLSVYPNPANEYAFLRYELSSPAEIKIELYDISGRTIKTLVEGNQTAGNHLEIVNVKELSPQIYFVKISAGNQSVTRKLSAIR